MKYQDLTDTGIARKRTLWTKKYNEAGARAGRSQNAATREWWTLKQDEAAADLEAIRAVLHLRSICRGV